MSLKVDMKKNFGNFKLDISFSVDAGILSLLGASGCGKSMTLKCIAGIETPDEGIIVLDGVTLFDSARNINLPPRKRRAGYLFQNSALFPNMTAAQNILCGVHKEKSKDKKQRTLRDMISLFHLEGLEERYPSQLSGGQQQRVAIARILVSEPELIMLDEPFSALDSHLRWKLEQELNSILHGFGGTAIFVSHNRGEVFRLSDRVAVISDGSVDAIGEKWDLFNNPKTYTAGLLTGCKNISAASEISPGAFYASDWGLELSANMKVEDNANCVGIRAHHIKPCESPDFPNAFEYVVERAFKDTFSYILYIRKKDALSLETIRWEISHETYENLRHGKKYAYIPPERVLLLKR